MAQRVNIILVDDIDQGDADETVQFALDGIAYEIDLSDVHAKELRESLNVYVQHGRRVGGRKKATGSPAPAPAAAKGPSASEIRAWAKEQGIEITDRGRIPADLRERYEAAH